MGGARRAAIQRRHCLGTYPVVLRRFSPAHGLLVREELFHAPHRPMGTVEPRRRCIVFRRSDQQIGVNPAHFVDLLLPSQ